MPSKDMVAAMEGYSHEGRSPAVKATQSPSDAREQPGNTGLEPVREPDMVSGDKFKKMSELAQAAWQVRIANFPPEITFDYPGKTGVISVTGAACALNCAHCGGHYLSSMHDPDYVSLGLAQEKDYKSYLVSGGCDVEGKVPLLEHRELLEVLGKNARLNLHAGLVDEEEAQLLGKMSDRVSFDLVVDEETIHEVFGLNKGPEDYIKAYQALQKHTYVVPHVLIGIKGGEIKGEYRILDELERLGAPEIVFLVFMPTRGTRYEKCTPPAIVDVVYFLASARVRFPHTPLTLGCMRPRGRYREELDRLAIDVGINQIVQPAPPVVEYAISKGLNPRRGEECCIF